MKRRFTVPQYILIRSLTALLLLGIQVALSSCSDAGSDQNQTSSATQETAQTLPDTTPAVPVPDSAAMASDSATAPVIEPLHDSAHLTDARARYLAGLLPSDTLAQNTWTDLADSAYWQQHAAKIKGSWGRFNQHRKQVARWADTSLTDPRQQKHVFYPFSGPDFTHVYTLFPDADSYTLIGLEPVGSLPALERYAPDQQKRAFKRLTKALNSLLTASFFITKDMDTVLRGQELRGTTPILHFFMARAGCQLLGYELVTVNPEGALVPSPAAGNSAVRIRFAINGQAKELLYIQGNLNNAGLATINPGLKKYIENLPNGTTYLKSASYLLHSANFTSIRNLILDKSAFVLQDDSGLPFKTLKPTEWRVTLFGKYTGPIRLFSHRMQPDMLHAYKDSAAAGHALPLRFRLGYGKMEQINLQLAQKLVP